MKARAPLVSLREPSLFDCPVSAAIAARAGASDDERDTIFTREVADFFLDLAGERTARPLPGLGVLSPPPAKEMSASRRCHRLRAALKRHRPIMPATLEITARQGTSDKSDVLKRRSDPVAPIRTARRIRKMRAETPIDGKPPASRPPALP